MLTLRLQRVGRKHDPSYRIVATNSRTGPKSNKHAAVLGHYDTIRKTKTIDAEAVKDWLAKGAQVSDTLRNILIGEGIMEGRKVNALPKKAPVIDEEAIAKAKEEEEAKVAAEAKAVEEAKAPTEEATEELATDTDAPADVTPAEEEETPAEEAPTDEPAAEEETPAEEEAAPVEEEEKKDEVNG